MSDQTEHIPDPRTDADAFQAWSILYLDRVLELKDELAFERKLIESPEAALAFRQAAEMDVSLFEAASAVKISSGPVKRRKPKSSTAIPKVTRIPSLQSAKAEALDPRNQDDMQFVSTVCTEITSHQQADRETSQRNDRITRGWRKYWMQGFVAAGVAGALTLVFAGQLMQADPENGVARHLRHQGPSQKAGSNPGANAAEDAAAGEHEGRVADGSGEMQPRQPAPQPNLPHHDNARDIAANLPDAPPAQKSATEADLVLTATDKTERLSAPALSNAGGSVDPLDAERLNEGTVWLPLGSVAVERDAGRAEINFKREENAFTRDEKVFGGLLYLRALDPLRSPSLKLSIDASIFSSSMDFQFVLFNKLNQGKRVHISPKDFLPQIKDAVNLKERRHTLEIVVKKFNQYELRIDGVAVNHTEPLLQAEWDKLYIGFLVSARGSDTETVSIERVIMGGSESRK